MHFTAKIFANRFYNFHKISLLLILVIAEFCILPISTKIVTYSLKTYYISSAPDGVAKKVLTFNGQFPGPTLHAAKGDLLSISVTNLIQDFQTTTIHWHGLEQYLTPFQDGPRMITQCDIPYNSTHIYNIPLKQSGTYWYHAHHTGQASEGLWGAIIIDNTPAEVHRYDGEFLLALSDWYHKPSHELATWYQDLQKSRGGIPIPDAGLINGLGNYPCAAARDQGYACNETLPTPRYKLFEVERGKTYRFRVLNSATIVLFAVSIDGHKLETIETDGVDTIRVARVDRATVSTGARTSFLVRMDGDLDQYWIRIWTDLAPYKTTYANINPRPDIYNGDPYLYAVLRYKENTARGVVDTGDVNEGAVQGRPDSHGGTQDWDFPAFPVQKGIQIETINGQASYQDPMIVPLATPPYPSTTPTENPVTLKHMDCLPFGTVTAPTKVNQVIRIRIPSVDNPANTFKPGFNNIPFSTKDLDKPALVKVINGEKLPAALNPIEIKGFGENYVVELIIDDFGDTGHPLHLHGHTFWVLGYGKEGDGPFNETRHRPILRSGVRRETIAVQPGAWLVIRFRADNPGVWLFHCHMNFHFEASLGLVLISGRNLAEQTKIPQDMKELCKKSGISLDKKITPVFDPCDFANFPAKDWFDFMQRKFACLFNG